MKTTLKLAIIALVALSGSIRAQSSLIWKKMLPNPYVGYYYQTFTDAQNNVYVVSDGGLLNSVGLVNIYKMNSSGDTLWSVATVNRILDGATDNAGNVYLAGNMKVGFANKAKVMKISPTGTLLWDNIYFDPEHSFDEISDLEVDQTDGSVYVAARDYEFNGWNATSKSHIFTVAKISPAGAQVWKYSYAGPLKNDLPMGYKRVMLDASNNPIIICNVNINATYPYISSAVYAAKFNPAGVKQWDTILRAPTQGVIPYLVKSINCKEAMLDANNDIFFIGDSATNIKYTKISGATGGVLYTKLLPVNNGGGNLQTIKGNKPYIISTRSGGKINLYDIGATGDTTLKTQIQSADATYTLNQLYDTKRINNKLYLNYRIYETIPPQGNNVNKFMLIRVNETTYQQDWSLIYDQPTGKNNFFWADASDNVYISRDTTVSGNARRFLVEKHNTNQVNPVGIKNVVQAGAISLYPNPVNDQLYFDTNNINSIPHVEIYNMQGQLQGTGNKGTSIDVSGLQTGIYMIRVSTNGQTSTAKFIKN